MTQIEARTQRTPQTNDGIPVRFASAAASLQGMLRRSTSEAMSQTA